MPQISPYDIELSEHEQTTLEALARRYTSPYRDVLRAKIILYASQGLPNDVIAARLDTPRQIVSKWRKRFFDSRLPGLDEQPRGGAPARFSPPASSSPSKPSPVSSRTGLASRCRASPQVRFNAR
jgi:Homeodomain-like domain